MTLTQIAALLWFVILAGAIVSAFMGWALELPNGVQRYAWRLSCSVAFTAAVYFGSWEQDGWLKWGIVAVSVLMFWVYIVPAYRKLEDARKLRRDHRRTA